MKDVRTLGSTSSRGYEWARFLKKENWERENIQQNNGVSGGDAGVVTRDQETNWHINVKINL